jgi:hypothetical protein
VEKYMESPIELKAILMTETETGFSGSILKVSGSVLNFC